MTTWYPVERISAHSKIRCRLWYKVHWVDSAAHTWEPRSHVQGCCKLVDYEDSGHTRRVSRIPESLRIKAIRPWPPMRQLMSLRRVEVRVCVRATRNAGLGLFAGHAIPHATVVARFPYGNCSWVQWARHCQRHRIPAHHAIQSGEDEMMMFYDVTYSKQRKPSWTYINHSKRRPNVKLVVAGDCVEFRADGRVRKGTELRWRYNLDAPEVWGAGYKALFEHPF